MRRFHYIMAALFLIFALCVAMVGYSRAQAGPMCGLRADFIRSLKDKYQEHGVAMAITGRVNVVELLRTKNGSTWTMIVTDTKGITCIIGAGENWKDLPPEILGDDS